MASLVQPSPTFPALYLRRASLVRAPSNSVRSPLSLCHPAGCVIAQVQRGGSVKAKTPPVWIYKNTTGDRLPILLLHLLGRLLISRILASYGLPTVDIDVSDGRAESLTCLWLLVKPNFSQESQLLNILEIWDTMLVRWQTQLPLWQKH